MCDYFSKLVSRMDEAMYDTKNIDLYNPGLSSHLNPEQKTVLKKSS